MATSKRVEILFLISAAVFVAMTGASPTYCAEDAASSSPEQVSIVLGDGATMPEQIAAEELAAYLNKCYSNTRFQVTSPPPAGQKAIYLGTPQSARRLGQLIGDNKLLGPESYVVTHAVVDGHDAGLIVGADAAGVVYGVYGLLEKLGCGFFLDFETVPDDKRTSFDFADWNLANHPLVPIRLVFNWHNFLSGCTSWDLPQWKQWIAQSQKLGYNTIMVHVYGNNPMFTFALNGITKPVGYVATSRRGRDWSTNHVNDVRRLYGGFVFDDAVFGAAVGKVPEDQRVAATQSLMRSVFEYADRRECRSTSRLDYDLPTSNPQEIILTLPKSDRFEVEYNSFAWRREHSTNRIWLSRPDKPQGFAYYKAQAKALIELYPQIDTLTLWRRRNLSIWTELKIDDLPPEWRKEYREYVADKPAAGMLHQSVPAFALGKLAAAWRRALDELGREDVQLAVGSWRISWLPAAAEFLPENVKLLPLDAEFVRRSDNLHNQELMREVTAAVAPGQFVPIIWAQHDDGRYVERRSRSTNPSIVNCKAGMLRVLGSSTG